MTAAGPDSMRDKAKQVGIKDGSFMSKKELAIASSNPWPPVSALRDH